MIIGHKKIIDGLEKNIIDNNLLHAYIFCGADGIGKKKVAFDFAEKILCKNEKDKLMFRTQNHPDFKYICPDDKNSIKIEKIREMIIDVYVKPIKSEYKVYIIDDADKITVQAQNALLKTLEEPSTFCTIILITSKYFEIIDTIRSRATKIQFENLSDEDIKKYMKDNNINIDIEEEKSIYLINGSIKNVYTLEKNVAPIKLLDEYINKKHINIIEMDELSKILVDSKDNINDILDFFVELLNYEIKKNINDNIRIEKLEENIEIVQKTKRYIKGNINFDICIDYLIMHIWEE